MIVGICGLAGSGKDTAADFLVHEHGFVRVGLADPMKRFCREVFDFSDEQLWGPSGTRNASDDRYVQMYAGALGTIDDKPNPANDIMLTPRHALQQLGTEWGRACCTDVWIDYALRVAQRLLNGRYAYTPQAGLRYLGPKAPPAGVVIPDIRFDNELRAVRAVRGAVWRIHRSGAGLRGAAAEHASEAGQSDLPVELFSQHIANNGTLEDLQRQVHEAIFWQRKEAA